MITFRGFLVAVLGLVPAFALAGLFVGLGEMLGLPEALLGWGCFLILFGVPAAIYYLIEKAHERKCEEVLRAEGFARVEKGDDDLRRDLEVFPGSSMRAQGGIRNHFKSRRDGAELSVFDFEFAQVPDMPRCIAFLFTVHPKLSLIFVRLRTQTAVLYRSPHMTLPQFFLRVRKVVQNEGRLLPCLGEEVPMPPEFARKYSLRSVDPQRVRDVFSPDVTSHLLGHRRFQIEGVGDTLIVCRPGCLPEAKKIKPFLDEVLALLGLFEAAARRD